MAQYAFDFYGSSLYGDQSPTEYTVGNFRATPATFLARVNVSWQNASGDWTDFKLIRNFFGFPAHEGDGDVLVHTATPGSTYVDLDLAGGEFVYYAIFLYDPTPEVWVRAGIAVALTIKDHGYNDYLYDLVPMHIRESDEDHNLALQRFLKVFGFGFNLIRTEYETLRTLRDIDQMPGTLLPYHSELLGYTYEPAMGMPQQRILLRNGVYLSKVKGTKPGVEGAASAYTGWGADVEVGKNLMLSSEKYIWTPTLAALDYSTDPEDSDTQVLSFVATGGGSTEGRTAPTGSERTWGIPVVAGTVYGFSCESWAVDSSRDVTLEIEWFDTSGAALTPSTSGATTNAIGSWTSHTLSASAPTGAQWAVPNLTITATGNGEEHLVKNIQFEVGSPSAYEHPRLVYIDLNADRINLCTNPNFEVDDAGWTAGANTTQTQSGADSYVGSSSLSLEAVGAGNVSSEHLVDNRITAGRNYTFSAYVKPNTTVRSVRLDVHWEGSGGSDLGTDTGTAVVEDADWLRVSEVFNAPTGALDATLIVTFLSAATTEIHRVDAVLIEEADYLDTYFDGSLLGADALWSGDPHASESHFYRNRTVKNARLNVVLDEFLPPDREHELRYAQT